jgi:hypothetical protein
MWMLWKEIPVFQLIFLKARMSVTVLKQNVDQDKRDDKLEVHIPAYFLDILMGAQ